MSTDPAVAPKSPHPLFLAAMMIPYGVTGGFVTVTFVYLLSHAGVSVQAIGAAVALYISMSAWKVLWAPLVDAFGAYRGWYAFGAIGSCLAILALSFIPIKAGAMGALTLLFLTTGFFQSLSAMANDGLVAHASDVTMKGRAGGWVQAGSLGGSGLGGGGGLWLATHVNVVAAGGALALVGIASSLAVFRFAEPIHHHRDAQVLTTFRRLGREVLELVRGRAGAMGIFILLLPLGTGAASNLFPAVAKDFGASAEVVALVTGALGGLVTIPSSLAGGYLADRLGRKTVYWGGGVLMALVALGMGLAAKTETTFIAFTLAYTVALGVIWGAYSGVVYEAAGRGAAATKCNLMAGLSNVPISAMTALDGWAQSRWETSGMLVFEAMTALAAVCVFIAGDWLTRPRSFAAAAAGPAS